jgi:hypothetical protein
MGKRRGPSAESMGDSIDHAYDHQGDTGKFGDFFEDGIPKWKVPEGEHQLMVVPYHIKNAQKSKFRRNESLNKPFTEKDIKNDNCWDWKLSILVHSGIGYGQDRVICLRTIKKRCPICEYVDSLDWTENEESIKALRSYKRGLLNILIHSDSKEKKKGIQIWEAAHSTIIDAISRLARKGSDKGKKLFNIPSENWDINFERQGSGKTDTRYLDLSIVKRDKEHQLSESKYEKLEDEAFNLEKIIKLKTEEELETLLQETLDGSDGGDFSKKKKKKDKKESSDNNDNNNDDNDDDNDDDSKVKKGKGKKKKDSSDNNNNDDNDNNNNDDNDNDNNNNDDNDDDKKKKKGKEKEPKCFGLNCNNEEECDDCKHWKACYKAWKKRKKK